MVAEIWALVISPFVDQWVALTHFIPSPQPTRATVFHLHLVSRLIFLSRSPKLTAIIAILILYQRKANKVYFTMVSGKNSIPVKSYDIYNEM